MSRYRIYPDHHLATATRAELLAWLASRTRQPAGATHGPA